MSQVPDWLGGWAHPTPSTRWLWHHSQDWMLPETPAMRGPEAPDPGPTLQPQLSPGVLPSFHSHPPVTSLQPLGAKQNGHHPSMGWVSLEGSGRSCNAVWEIEMPESWEIGVEAYCRVKRLFRPSETLHLPAAMNWCIWGLNPKTPINAWNQWNSLQTSQHKQGWRVVEPVSDIKESSYGIKTSANCFQYTQLRNCHCHITFTGTTAHLSEVRNEFQPISASCVVR